MQQFTKPSGVTMHAIVLLLCLLSAATTFAQKGSSSNSPNITITNGEGGRIYHWEVSEMPSSLGQMKGPFRLEETIVPGKDNFEIVQDSSSGSEPNGSKSRGSKITLPAAEGKDTAIRVLRSIYPAKSYARSKDKHPSFVAMPLPNAAFSGPKARYIRIEYQLKFQPGFQWVKGGKLPGALIGSEKGCNAACSGGGSAENCFSTRLMWRKDGQGELYLYAAKSVYFPKEAPETCKRSLDKRSPEALFLLEQRQMDAVAMPEYNDDDELSDDNEPHVLAKRAETSSCLKGMRIKTSPGARSVCNPKFGISIGRGGAFKFQAGNWHNVTQVLKVNSKGKAVKDGYLAVYLDGNVVIEAQDLVLLKNGYDPQSKDATMNQVKFMFSSFFGGGSSDYATPVEQWIDWKGFSMTTSGKNMW
ncbi:hypothetical protein BGW38_005450 [Lunasporangiospora selenospora]|uniref:Polysaccharide lyase 14 domain-containing protein n=1 Tax=Lunasporangiospora selenospora TaxID=979761 RepID=A0A9P6KBC4_9FUNG|nr:hypothetical protein BGW38_005450 [Lunasporangiospora selenospora]